MFEFSLISCVCHTHCQKTVIFWLYLVSCKQHVKYAFYKKKLLKYCRVVNFASIAYVSFNFFGQKLLRCYFEKVTFLSWCEIIERSSVIHNKLAKQASDKKSIFSTTARKS